jgi:membrane protease YdiL (CAAX protease family)
MECSYCRFVNEEEFIFCSNCGKKNVTVYAVEKKSSTVLESNVKWLLAYILLSLILLMANHLSPDTGKMVVVWSLTFAVIDIVFAVSQSSAVTPYIFMKQKDLKFLPLVFIIFLIHAPIVNFLINSLNTTLFEEIFIFNVFYEFENPLFYSILFVGVLPAIFEELAFRGFIYRNFEIISGQTAAIWGSAIIFALVHFSLLSLIWLLPFGLILALMRKRFGSIIPGIIAHFVHNTTVVLLEHYDIWQ